MRRNETDREHADEPIISQIDSRKVELSKITLKELDLLSKWVIYSVAVIDVLFLLDLFFIASQNYYLNNMKCLGCTSDSV